MTEKCRRFEHHQHAMLIDDERYARWDPPRFLAPLGVKEGETVLDLGCGPGFWTMALAGMVGRSGTVWGLDGSQEMLDALAKRSPPPQVKPLLSEMPAIALPDNSVELAWASFVFHEVTPHEALAAEVRRVLKQGGTVAILEWRADGASTSGPPRHHRLSTEEMSLCLRSAGFTCVIETWRDEDHYLMLGS